jgi:hypothetical protein
MRQSTRSITTYLALAVPILFAILATQAFAAAPRITATSRAEPSHTLTPAERRAMSLAAGRILRHAYLARQAVAEEDGQRAESEVDQGLKLVQIIEKVQPKYKVTAEIKAGDLSYSADEVVAPPLVPIYDEVGEVELLAPVVAAKKEQQVGREDVVEDVSVEHTALSLNLAFAKAGLTQAKKALRDSDLKRADAALAVVQRSAVFEIDALDVPLATARENLFTAKLRVGRGDSEGAKEALDAASKALDGYAELAGDERSKEVRQLQSEISKLSSDLASGGGKASATADVEEKILSWWDRVVQWWEE